MDFFASLFASVSQFSQPEPVYRPSTSPLLRLRRFHSWALLAASRRSHLRKTRGTQWGTPVYTVTSQSSQSELPYLEYHNIHCCNQASVCRQAIHSRNPGSDLEPQLGMPWDQMGRVSREDQFCRIVRLENLRCFLALARKLYLASVI
jgi:hypothetical protein